jgi:hypothetical protein
MKYVPSHVPEKNVNYMWTTNSFTCEVRIQNKRLCLYFFHLILHYL